MPNPRGSQCPEREQDRRCPHRHIAARHVQVGQCRLPPSCIRTPATGRLARDSIVRLSPQSREICCRRKHRLETAVAPTVPTARRSFRLCSVRQALLQMQRRSSSIHWDCPAGRHPGARAASRKLSWTAQFWPNALPMSRRSPANAHRRWRKRKPLSKGWPRGSKGASRSSPRRDRSCLEARIANPQLRDSSVRRMSATGR